MLEHPPEHPSRISSRNFSFVMNSPAASWATSSPASCQKLFLSLLNEDPQVRAAGYVVLIGRR